MTDLIKAADRLANFSEDYANGLIALEDFRAAITAYRTAREAGEDTRAAPKVKPLVWEEKVFISTDDDNGPLEGIPRKLSCWVAGEYQIIKQAGKDGLFILRGMSDGCGLVLPRLDQAKAAAEVDHRSIHEAPSAAPWSNATDDGKEID